MKGNLMDYVKKCNKCQCYSNILQAPLNELTLMTSPWPFVVWDIDLIGSLPMGKEGVKYAIVAIDYFMKWVEVKPLATITSKKAMDFVIKNMACHYGFSRKIVSNNALQFDSELFTVFYERHGVMKSFSSIAHPQSNEQVEAANKTLKANLKKRLE
ncbi:uncharacterized protein LOC133805764 [Humulus lupulus]|uniref:uncharacterized protein LOC133805764 n=1 Tax=Humulus lupulus TaxID=3486 RepID=UPI002B414711|nr:uncharacterized protein LOC133805764 [Humulus lupulus]